MNYQSRQQVTQHAFREYQMDDFRHLLLNRLFSLVHQFKYAVLTFFRQSLRVGLVQDRLKGRLGLCLLFVRRIHLVLESTNACEFSFKEMIKTTHFSLFRAHSLIWVLRGPQNKPLSPLHEVTMFAIRQNVKYTDAEIAKECSM